MADKPENDEITESAADADASSDAPVEATDAAAESNDAVAESGGAAEETAPEEASPVAEAEGAPPADAAPVEQLPSKERRRRARSKHDGEARAQRSPEERHAERVAERKRKAVRRRARRLQERAKAAEQRKKAPAPEPLAPVHAPVEGARRVRQGVVVSDKAQKTITVRIDVARPHRRYEKIVRSSSTLHAHDENNDAHEGDVVRVIESRPLSRSKRWRLVDVLERAR